eukprot:1749899-Rhodomonas_salina.1
MVQGGNSTSSSPANCLPAPPQPPCSVPKLPFTDSKVPLSRCKPVLPCCSKRHFLSRLERPLAPDPGPTPLSEPSNHVSTLSPSPLRGAVLAKHAPPANARGGIWRGQRELGTRRSELSDSEEGGRRGRRKQRNLVADVEPCVALPRARPAWTSSGWAQGRFGIDLGWNHSSGIMIGRY